MVEVEMTKDIREREPKIIGFFTKRQLLCLLLGAIVAVPVALLVPFDTMGKVMAGSVAVCPFAACGWVSVYDMKLEQFVVQAIKTSFIYPVKRKYKIESSVKFLDEKKPTGAKPKIKPSAEYKPHK